MSSSYGCFCGNVAGRFGSANDNGDQCGFPCTGNSQESCGGLHSNYIYYLPHCPGKIELCKIII